MTRFERLTATLLLLHTRRVVRGEDVAERFGVSVRTVYRDVRALEAAGLPLCSQPGVGYSLAEDYRLAPVAFTGDEALALLAAEKLAAGLADPETARHVTSAMDKVRAGLWPADRDRLADSAPLVEVLGARGGGPLPETYSALLAAASTRRVVRLSYRSGSAAQATERDVEPLGLFFEGSWRAAAFCRLRGDVRTFRLDRVERAEVLDETFAPRAETLGRYLARQDEGRTRLPPARVRFRADADRGVLSAKVHYGWISEETTPDGETEMTFVPTTLEYLAAWLLPQAAHVVSVTPPALSACLGDLAARAHARFCAPA